MLACDGDDNFGSVVSRSVKIGTGYSGAAQRGHVSSNLSGHRLLVATVTRGRVN